MLDERRNLLPRLANRKELMKPGIVCDNCGEVCRPHFIAGQCQTCGGHICKQCVPYHLCMPRPIAEVRRMMPEFFEYGVNDANVNAAV